MNSFPEQGFTDSVLRGDEASTVPTARFDTDLRTQPGLVGGAAAHQRAEAHAAGYAAGWAQGRREAEVQARAVRERIAADARRVAEAHAIRLQEAMTAIAEAAAGLEQRMVPVAVELEDIVVRLAMELAEVVIGRELATATEPGREAVARVLGYVPAGRPVTVRISPADHASLTGSVSEASSAEIDGREVTLLADPSLQPGDAVAECDATTVDGRITAALQRAREVLGL